MVSSRILKAPLLAQVRRSREAFSDAVDSLQRRGGVRAARHDAHPAWGGRQRQRHRQAQQEEQQEEEEQRRRRGRRLLRGQDGGGPAAGGGRGRL